MYIHLYIQFLLNDIVFYVYLNHHSKTSIYCCQLPHVVWPLQFKMASELYNPLTSISKFVLKCSNGSMSIINGTDVTPH